MAELWPAAEVRDSVGRPLNGAMSRADGPTAGAVLAGDWRRPNTGRPRVSKSSLDQKTSTSTDLLAFLWPSNSFAPPNFNPGVSNRRLRSRSDHLPRLASGPLEIYDVLDGLPYPSEFFDVIHQRNLSKWVPDLGALFHEIHRCLKPGGIFLVTEPTVRRPLSSGRLKKRADDFRRAFRRASFPEHRGTRLTKWR